MLELLLKLSDITEKMLPIIMVSSFFNYNYFVSLFFWHTGFAIEYVYFIDDNIFYIFYILFFGVLIDWIFFFFWKLWAKIFWKKLSGNYLKTLENYFLLYFRFVPFLGYFWSTIVWYYSQIQLKKLIGKIFLWNILRFWMLLIFYFISISIHKLYFDEITVLLHQAGKDIDFTGLVLHILFYFSFIIIVSIFYAIKYKNLKKQRKYW